mmetsp:Transcript_19535/g.54499  ORF Transcript_19535/g.54499 Transcript_19535/m.54499 type:complete len:163 (-) Transcript_19535:320-808(-)|eukprot:CAMPEP_0172360414 /NCGR_PEP_ID=MMETSP1060-20121228/4441_1 /TAXON_ID=37318 /ORGANISM="Pseudo-nitzschia pungens, Strain cf. cingulata" /LENGTH=162 /DNA_ID=CAMNT_0013082397 /DNA_START=220 /DNA_END=708 /DNA_ORIENTATION=+
MVAEMSYDTVSTVIDSWEALRRIKHYEATVGTLLFIKFFALLPEAKSVFGLNKGKMTDAEFYRSRRFLAHAKHFVGILDSAIDMLGPDLEMLTEIFLELGQTHRTRYKVKPEYFAVLGEALIETLRDILGPGVFDRHTTDCWSQVYGELSKDMIAGMARTVG